MTNRKFHKTTIQVEVLSEEPFDCEDLEGINYAITEGDCSGTVRTVKKEVLNGQQAAQALQEQESDPGFFNLTAEGDDDEDCTY